MYEFPSTSSRNGLRLFYILVTNLTLFYSEIVSFDDSWLPVPEEEGEKLSGLYFNEVKLSAWSKTAEYIQVCVHLAEYIH